MGGGVGKRGSLMEMETGMMGLVVEDSAFWLFLLGSSFVGGDLKGGSDG